MPTNERTPRRAVLGTIAAMPLGIAGLSRRSTAQNVCGETVGVECGGGGSSLLDTDVASRTDDVLDGEFTLESTLAASEYNAFHDPDYCDYTHRIHFAATGNAFIDDDGDYEGRPAVGSNELFLEASGDVVDTTQQKHEEAIGAYEALEEKATEDDHYEALASAAVSGAVGVGTTLAYSNPASGIVTSMAFSYLTSRAEGDSQHEYELLWDWDKGTGNLGEGVEDSCVYARMDVTTRTGDSADVYASNIAGDMSGIGPISAVDFTVDSPDECENPSLSTQSPGTEETLVISADELSPAQRDRLLGERARTILERDGSLSVKRDTTVGRSIEALRDR